MPLIRTNPTATDLVRPPPRKQRSDAPPPPTAAAPDLGHTPSAALAPSPGRAAFLRHPLRFLRSRLRMLYGPPLSVRWGLDRGLPAHRHYLKLFLDEHRGDIHGTCLEFSAREYADHFGGEAVVECDVLDLDASNPRATIIADITVGPLSERTLRSESGATPGATPNQIPSDRYDCVICTHVLHVVPDLNAAVKGLHRMLKPGGVLLCAVPMTSVNDESMRELWRFTRLGLETILAREFGVENVQTRAYGNSVIAAGEMRGMIADEFTWRELNTHDPRAAVEICGRALKVG